MKDVFTKHIDLLNKKLNIIEQKSSEFDSTMLLIKFDCYYNITKQLESLTNEIIISSIVKNEINSITSPQKRCTSQKDIFSLSTNKSYEKLRLNKKNNKSIGNFSKYHIFEEKQKDQSNGKIDTSISNIKYNGSLFSTEQNKKNKNMFSVDVLEINLKDIKKPFLTNNLSYRSFNKNNSGVNICHSNKKKKKDCLSQSYNYSKLLKSVNVINSNKQTTKVINHLGEIFNMNKIEIDLDAIVNKKDIKTNLTAGIYNSATNQNNMRIEFNEAD
jgi:hypothetical protein